LDVHRELTLMTCMSSSSWLKVEERLISTLLVFVRCIDMLNIQYSYILIYNIAVCLNYWYTARTPTQTPQGSAQVTTLPTLNNDLGKICKLSLCLTSSCRSPLSFSTCPILPWVSIHVNPVPIFCQVSYLF
jgi:hypothetical protein